MRSRSENAASDPLRALLKHPGIWRSSERACASFDTIPTGFATLDAALPGGGWPKGALTEISSDARGIGELRLLMPALAALAEGGYRLVWVSPPHVPYAPALSAYGVDLSKVVWVRAPSPAESLWAAEQALRAAGTGAVLLWLARSGGRALRRLQLAAETAGSWGVLFADAASAAQPSPAALRLALEPSGEGLRARILKCRGRASGEALFLEP